MSDQPTRRSVLKTAAAGAMAMAATPNILKAMKTDQPVIIGAGAHTYEVVPGWGTLPAGKTYGNTHGVCETADGRIFIHNASPTKDCVCEFEPDGKFIRSWGLEFYPGAHGMQLRRENGEEFLYFATTSEHSVIKTNIKGEHVFELKYPKDAKDAHGKPCYEDASKFVPTNIAFHPTDGSFYVADGYGLSFVHHYDAKGNYLSTFGGKGTAPGQMNCPHGIFLDSRDPANPMIVVADRANSRLQYFDFTGKYLSMVTENLRLPCHFDQRNGELLIPDLKGRVTIFDKNNQLVIHLGDNPDPAKRANNGVPQDQLVPGQFCSPHQAIWDRNGNIYCVEWLHYGRITKLKRVMA